jgi:hypothetical protein
MRTALIAMLIAAFAPAAGADDLAQPPPPPRPTPFDRGRFGLSAGVSSQTEFDVHYFVIGAGVAYYVIDGLSLGLSGFHEFGNGPSISELSPEVRYVAQPLVYKWPVVPYVGTFYKHLFVGENPDVDSIGVHGGLMFVSGQLVLGLGVAVERQITVCNNGCEFVYPDLIIALSL